MAPAVRSAKLRVAEAFGLPESMRKAIEQVQRGEVVTTKPRFDRTQPSALSASVQRLLSPSLYELLTHLSEQGVRSVDLAYMVDRATGPKTTPAVKIQTHTYVSASASSRKCMLLGVSDDTGVVAISGDEARIAVERHATTANYNVSVGEGAEMVHELVARAGPELRALLVHMWLVHLDVVAQADVRVRIDAAAVSRLLHSADLRDECEEAKRLPGVRVHVNSLDNVGRALLVAACDNTTVTQTSARLGRYYWRAIPLTLYGGRLATSLDVRLDSAVATARSIVMFAERFGALQACGDALATALWLYGTPTVPRRLDMLYSMPRLHDSVHEPVGHVSSIWHCHDLATQDLVALAKFVGLALNQVCSHTLRQVVHSLNEKDIVGVEQVLVGNHETRVRHAGRQLQRQLAAKWPGLVSLPTLLTGHLPALWLTQGIQHALVFGVVVTGTALAEAIKPMRVPTGKDVAMTDDPLAGKAAKRAGAELFFVSELLSNCYAKQNQSIDALASDMPAGATIVAGVSLHHNCAVGLTVVGVSGSRRIDRIKTSAWCLPPPVPALADHVEEGWTLASEKATRLPATSQALGMDDLLGAARGPRAPTRMVPSRPRPPVTPPKPNEHAVTEVAAPAVAAFTPVVDAGWGPQPTSGEGALCGANALRQSLAAQQSTLADVEAAPELLVEALRSVLPGDADPGLDAGAVLQGADNFTADQLAAVCSQLGARLGVVDRGPDGSLRAYTISSGTDPVVWLHNEANHWSSIGPTQNPYHTSRR